MPYRWPHSTRLLWGYVLCEREGLSLLFVQSPDNVRSSVIAITTEHVEDMVYVDVNVNNFPLEKADLRSIGSKMKALHQMFVEDDFKDFFRPDTLWPDDD